MRRLGADRILALGMAVFSLAYIYSAWRLPRFTMSTVVDADVFPIAVGLFLLVLSAALWVEAGSGLLGKVIYSWAGFDFKALLIHTVLVTGFILALEPLGFLITTFIYLTLAAHFMGYPRFKVILTVAALFSVGTYLLFNVVLNVPLPAGILGFLGL